MAHKDLPDSWAHFITLDEIYKMRLKIRASHCKAENHGDHDEIMARVLWTIAHSSYTPSEARALAIAALNCEDDVSGRWYS